MDLDSENSLRQTLRDPRKLLQKIHDYTYPALKLLIEIVAISSLIPYYPEHSVSTVASRLAIHLLRHGPMQEAGVLTDLVDALSLTILTGVNLTDAILINPKPLLLSYLGTLVALVQDEAFGAKSALTRWFSLTTFSPLSHTGYLSPGPFLHFLPLLSRSGCMLQQLYFADTPGPELVAKLCPRFHGP
ncbi:hypothetical protein C8R45DRAFT_1220108 [Mycena sanguinolenta]|nr:hypothetical protein C8R45DRAFT_1220108 [Mycena sanguinolenta]